MELLAQVLTVHVELLFFSLVVMTSLLGFMARREIDGQVKRPWRTGDFWIFRGFALLVFVLVIIFSLVIVFPWSETGSVTIFHFFCVFVLLLLGWPLFFVMSGRAPLRDGVMFVVLVAVTLGWSVFCVSFFERWSSLFRFSSPLLIGVGAAWCVNTFKKASRNR